MPIALATPYPMTSHRVQVIIVGAGPVGTVAAYYLAQHDIEVAVLEAAASCEEDLRASTLHSPTIKMLDQLGVAEDLLAKGLKAPVYQYRIRSTQEILEFDLGELADELEFPFRLQCEQYKLARGLASALQQHPRAAVHFDTRVVSFEARAAAVTLTAKTPQGAARYTADYVIAADGANSIIRKQLGVEFSGFTYPEKFLTLSTDAEMSNHFRNLSYVNYFSDPNEWFVLLRVPTAWRILVPVDESKPDQYILSDEHKDKIFDGLTGDGSSVVTHHRTIYRVHQRVARQFHHDRIVLVGDAAHLNNPLGGFGMNGGIHDAWNLCGRLVKIFAQGRDADAELAHFDRQRRATMNEFVQQQTIKNKRMMEEGPKLALRHEWEEMRTTNADPELRRAFMRRQSMMQCLLDEAKIA